MRSVAAGPPINRHCSVKATGERLDIERVPSRSEGSGWKSAWLGNSLAAYPTARTVPRGESAARHLPIPAQGDYCQKTKVLSK